MSQFDLTIRDKISAYSPQGNLDSLALFILGASELKHKDVKDHFCRVALLAERAAVSLMYDHKACFFAGLFHDIGKLLLPYPLFDGHNINEEEYSLVKEHALLGFKALKDQHLFTSLCAGLHHALYKQGYGIGIEDFPKEFSLATIKKILDISMLISICDFVDAYMHRTTQLKGDNNPEEPETKEPETLRRLLYTKYPEDKRIVEAVLDLTK